MKAKRIFALVLAAVGQHHRFGDPFIHSFSLPLCCWCGRCSAVDARQVVARRAAWASQHLKAAAGCGGADADSVPGAGANTAGSDLCTVAGGQRVLLSPGADGDVYRGCNGRGGWDTLRHYDTIFFAIVVSACWQVNQHIAAIICDSLANNQMLAQLANWFATHNDTSI